MDQLSMEGLNDRQIIPNIATLRHGSESSGDRSSACCTYGVTWTNQQPSAAAAAAAG
tara:strand:- start:177 stop:347 length:171 start_codon:yes stop_codon:yes gene_type:complete